MNRIAAEAPDVNMLMFVDEAAKDERTSVRRHGRSRKGVRCIARKCFVRGSRYSIVPVITLDGIIAYDIIEGPVDGARFVQFLKDHVVSQLLLQVFCVLILKSGLDAIHEPVPWSTECPGDGQLPHPSRRRNSTLS